MPRRSVMTRRRTPLPSAITGIPGSGFPKRVRAGRAHRGRTGLQRARPDGQRAAREGGGRRLYCGLLRLARRIGDPNERRGRVVEVVRFLLLGADADDVQRPSDGATLRDDRDRGRGLGGRRPRLQESCAQVPCDGVIESTFSREERSETRTTFTSAASSGRQFVTVIRNEIRVSRTAIGGVAVLRTLRSTVGAGGGTGIWGSVRRRGWRGRGNRRQRTGRGALRVFVNVHTTDVAVGDRAVHLRAGDGECHLAVPGAVDLRAVVAQAGAWPGRLTDGALADPDVSGPVVVRFGPVMTSIR